MNEPRTINVTDGEFVSLERGRESGARIRSRSACPLDRPNHRGGARDQLATRQPLQWRPPISRGMTCLDYYGMGDIRFPRLCLFMLVPGRRSRLIRPRPRRRSVRF